MTAANLEAYVRSCRGRGCRNRLQAQGLLPAVVYGKNIGSLPVAVSTQAVQGILTNAGRNPYVALKIVDEGREEVCHALIKEVQYHLLKKEPVHLGFQVVTPESK
ncbi:MAG: hypothetical protein AB1330_05140 [Bacillota bacterium]